MTYWCIERYINSKVHYFTGNPRNYWSEKHDDALRFARSQDGECFLVWQLEGQGRIAEHMPVSKP